MLARGFAPDLPWTLRTSRPEVGFRSVEVVLPWLAGAAAGVNAAGIAALVGLPGVPAIDRGLGAPPAWLLVQECLQRFDGLDAALDWCLRRPASGECSILLADGAGEIAVVDFTSEGRQLRQRGSEPGVAGGAAAQESALRKRIAEGERFGAEWLRDESAAARPAPQVWLRPGAAELTWRPAEGDAEQLRATS